MRAGYDRIGRSITVQQAQRQCLNKKRFKSRNQARDFQARNVATYPDREPQSPYRCTLCGGWHLTRHKHQANPMPKRDGLGKG